MTRASPTVLVGFGLLLQSVDEHLEFRILLPLHLKDLLPLIRRVLLESIFLRHHEKLGEIWAANCDASAAA